MNKDVFIHKGLEIVILVGNHCSGKTTIAKEIYETHGYKIITLTTVNEMITEALKYVENQSIVFDSMNASISKRKYLIDFAKKNKRYVKCVYLTTSLEQCLKWNKNTPEIAFYIYRSSFEKPTANECDIVEIDIMYTN